MPHLSRWRFIVLSVLVLTCTTYVINQPRQVILLDPKDDDLVMVNGCVVSACNYVAILRARNKLERNFWSRVMLVRYEETQAGHAYCVWESDGQLFGYDRNGGSYPIPTKDRDPKTIAQALAWGIELASNKKYTVKRAEFVDPDKTKTYEL